MAKAIFPTGALDVTPSDTVNLAPTGWGIRCNGTAGNVSFVDWSDRTHVWPIAAGETITVGVKRINATGTTATSLATYLI
jgi:hypothetical protein